MAASASLPWWRDSSAESSRKLVEGRPGAAPGGAAAEPGRAEAMVRRRAGR